MVDRILDENLEDVILTEEGEYLAEDDGSYYVYVNDAGSGADSVMPVAELLSVPDTGAGDDGINPLLQTVVIPDFGHGADVFTRRKDNIYNTLNITFTPKLGKIIYNA